MLKNSKIEYNWIFQIIIGYYNCIVSSSCCFFFFKLDTTEGWFFQRVYLHIWDIAVPELSTLSLRVHNSLAVHDISSALILDNFSEF